MLPGFIEVASINCGYKKKLNRLEGDLSSRSQYVCYTIKTFDFSTLYTTIQHTLLKSRIKELIQCCFKNKNGEQRYQYFVVCRDKLTLSKAI